MADPLEHAVAALADLVESELALAWPEVEAKLSGRRNERPGFRYGLYPDLLTKARRILLASGRMQVDRSTTHGSHSIAIYTTANVHRRKTAIANAAAHKRRLMSHVRSWQQYFGREGERVCHATVLSLAPHGWMPEVPTRDPAETGFLFGKPITSGRMDEVAHLTYRDADGIPAGTVTVLGEVKSVRDFIYPDAPELFDLLTKAAEVQASHPRVAFMPLLVCREAVYETMLMAKELGFYVAQTYGQFVPTVEEIPEHQLDAVTQELNLDIFRTPKNGEWKILGNNLRDRLPGQFPVAPKRWKGTVEALGPQFRALRNDALQPAARRSLMTALADRARADLAISASWYSAEEPDEEPSSDSSW